MLHGGTREILLSKFVYKFGGTNLLFASSSPAPLYSMTLTFPQAPIKYINRKNAKEGEESQLFGKKQ